MDGSFLVQLTGDGGREGEQLAELEELCVLLLAPIPRRVLALVLLGHRETETVMELSRSGYIRGSLRGTSFNKINV